MYAIAGLHLDGLFQKVKASFVEAHTQKVSGGGKPPKYFPHRTLSSYANKNTKQLRQEPVPPVEAGLTLEQASMWKQVCILIFHNATTFLYPSLHEPCVAVGTVVAQRKTL